MTQIVAERVFNFSAGPAVLPEPVLAEIQENLLCLPGVGSSILEISHRGPAFTAILQSAKERIKRLLKVPDSHEVIFLQGGSRLQFSMIPMNFLRNSGKTAHYITTGSWGKKALAEAKREGSVEAIWDGADQKYSCAPAKIPEFSTGNSAYAYFTSNETIEGVQFSTEPDVGDVPLVCDASSDFMHRPLDIEKYGLIYACAQKNAGPAGVTIVILDKAMIASGRDDLPGYLNYESHVANDSTYNTPPTFGVYVVDLVAKWLEKEIGGLQAMHEINKQKAELLYSVIDNFPEFYLGHAENDSRSLMNVTFKFSDDSIQAEFLDSAQKRNLNSLKGHRSVGGIRASIYNAMPLQGVETLAEFMTDFANEKA